MVPKFRAYLKIHKKIVDVQEINYKYREIVWVNGKYTEVDNFEDIELLQSTGLFDKNGTEIYEGDIVKGTDGYVGYIAFLKQEMGYVIVYKNYDKRLGHRYRLDDGHLEILGNIYQDEHLLRED